MGQTRPARLQLVSYGGQFVFAGWKYQLILQKLRVMRVDSAGSNRFAISNIYI